MKPFLLTFVAFLPHFAIAVPPELSLPIQVEAAPGSSVFFPLALNLTDAQISAIQFDILYDNVSISPVALPGEAARTSGKRLYFADLAPNTRRFLLVGPNQNPIPGGVLIDLYLNLNLNTPEGTYPVAISNIISASPQGELFATNSVDGILTVQGSPEQRVRLQVTGVRNAASLAPGPVTPGGIVTLIGWGIGADSTPQQNQSSGGTILNGTSVTFDGIPAPLLYVSAGQINAIVPYGVFGKSVTQLQIMNAGRAVADIAVPVAEASPAIFTLDSSGVGAGAILNQDSSLNSPGNPAARGSVVVLFATGAGQTDPPGVDGQIAGDLLPKPLLPVSVQIGGVAAEILYAGAAPTLIAGVLQVNVRIPMELSPTHAAPIALTVGSTTSTHGVTVAVR